MGLRKGSRGARRVRRVSPTTIARQQAAKRAAQAAKARAVEQAKISAIEKASKARVLSQQQAAQGATLEQLRTAAGVLTSNLNTLSGRSTEGLSAIDRRKHELELLENRSISRTVGNVIAQRRQRQKQQKIRDARAAKARAVAEAARKAAEAKRQAILDRPVDHRVSDRLFAKAEAQAGQSQRLVAQLNAELRRPGRRSTRQANRIRAQIKAIPQGVALLRQQAQKERNFELNRNKLELAEQDRLAATFERFPITGVLPRSVTKAVVTKAGNRRLNSLRKLQRSAGILPSRRFEIQKQINATTIANRTALFQRNVAFQKSFEAQRQFKIRTSRQQARAAAAKGQIAKPQFATGGVAPRTAAQARVARAFTVKQTARRPAKRAKAPTAPPKPTAPTPPPAFTVTKAVKVPAPPPRIAGAPKPPPTIASQFAREGVPIDPRSVEGRVIARTLEEQRVARAANTLQRERFEAITGAKSGVEALQIAKEKQVPTPTFTFGRTGLVKGEFVDERGRKVRGEFVAEFEPTRGLLATPEGQQQALQILKATERPTVVEQDPQPIETQAITVPGVSKFQPKTGLVSVKRKDGSVVSVSPDTAEKLAARGDLAPIGAFTDDLDPRQVSGATIPTPLVAGVPALLGGINTIPFQDKKQVSRKESEFTPTLEGFKTPQSAARAEALDLDLTTLSSEESRKFIPGIDTVTKLPVKREVEEFIDPVTGQRGTRVTTTGGTQTVTTGGGEVITTNQIKGLKPVKSDFSDPLGSLFAGFSQSFQNEIIGIENLGALATGGEQKEFFATPSALAIGGAIDVAALGLTTEEARARGTQVQQSIERTIQADPFFAAGDFLAQGLLIFSPTKVVKGVSAGSRLLSAATRGARTAPRTKTIAGGVATIQKPSKVVKSVKGNVERSLFQTADTPTSRVIDDPFAASALSKGLAKGAAPVRREAFLRADPLARVTQEADIALPFVRGAPEIRRATKATVRTQEGLLRQVDIGGLPSPRVTTQPIRLGTGVGRRLGGAGFSVGRTKPPPGFSGTVVDLGGAAVAKVPKVTKSQIKALSKSAKVSEDQAEKILRKQASEAGRTGRDVGFKQITSKQGLLQVAKVTTKQSAKLKTLNKAKQALAKKKQAFKVSSIADQQTQKRLSKLIKAEKAKAPAKSVEKATQAALRKLINIEKAKIAKKATKAKPKPKPPITPLVRAADDVPTTTRFPPGTAAILTGAAVGTGVGLGLAAPPKPTDTPISGQQFIPSLTNVVKDPTKTTKTTLEPITTTIPTQDEKITTTLFTRTETPRVPRQEKIVDIFNRQRTDQFFDITRVEAPPTLLQQQFRLGRQRDVGRDVVPKTRRQRRFFRVFDVAKTPFGRVQRGLGVQVQSGQAIFEVEDVLGKPKARKNLNERFFDIKF